MAKVAAWDRHGAVRLVPLQDRLESKRLLAPMDEQTRMESWHLVTSDGRVYSAGQGFPALLELLPGGALPARLAAAMQPVTDGAYRFLADHRSAFGRLIPRRARERADKTLRQRVK